MPEINRLSRNTEWIDLEFVERQRTPEFAIQVGIQLHLAGLSLSNTKQYLERLGVERSRTAIHDWVRKAGLQPDSDVSPNQIAVDETVIRVNGQRHWLFAAVDPDTNQFLHVRLFQTRTTQLTVLFLRELREKQHLSNTTFLIDDAAHLKATLDRLGLRFRVNCHGNRNSVERVFHKVKRRTYSFSNTFSNARLPTVDSWLKAFAVWWNRCQS
ncbi:IS6 family transposase [Salinigranum halophilum]|uniref:IS6 family transposase n=1 Tax=Salinigranum halophilum TaxID=2565931 RepID=UPI00115D8AFB|nr:IS6 family transposase [Salinigranum halophilum]